MKTTIALPDSLYDLVKHWAAADRMEANPAIRDELLAQTEAAAQEIEEFLRDAAAR